MTKLKAANQRPVILWWPKFVTFTFYPYACSDQILAMIAAALFSSRCPKNVENEKFSSA